MGRITLSEIELRGFRAFLEPQRVSFSDGKQVQSLAIFAPNAHGKSSLVDAFEFLFSPNGTLERLGQKQQQSKAGKDALAHVDAHEHSVNPYVSMSFKEDKETLSAVRYVKHSDRRLMDMPSAASHVLLHVGVDFIIRGHQLRSFVEEQTPQQRYESFSKWFNLETISNLQKHIRDFRLALNKEISDESAMDERLKDLRKLTSEQCLIWNQADVVTWFNNTILVPLDGAVLIESLEMNDPGIARIVQRKEEENHRIGLSAIDEVLRLLQKIHAKDLSSSEDGLIREDALTTFETAHAAHLEARKIEQGEREVYQRAVFEKIWSDALELLQKDTLNLEVCPVCDTPLTATTSGSREALSLHIQLQLSSLQAYQSARQRLEECKRSLDLSQTTLKTGLAQLTTSLQVCGFTGQTSSLKLVIEDIEDVNQDFDTGKLRETLRECYDQTERARSDIVAKQGNQSYDAAFTKLNQIIELKGRIEHIQKTKGELKTLHIQLEQFEQLVIERCRRYQQDMVVTLKDEVNRLYRKIQSDGGRAIPEIVLELSPDSKQPLLNLLVKLTEQDSARVPSGYLSDSQLHTLALSLRLSAIKMVNEQVPLLVLDDIVTSYDADHRKAISSLLATDFDQFQILIVTHDERFFSLLKDHLPSAKWKFKIITDITRESGPKFHDHKIRDELIEGKLNRGESAANEIRQAEEEWLYKICRDFSVEGFSIRDISHPYAYDRSELAIALHRFLKDKRIEVPLIPGISNPFLVSLQSGVVENFGSHFQDIPYGRSSVGDERGRWKEFVQFRDRFTCACGSKEFKRPRSVTLPLCKKCETSFKFSN